MVSRKLMICKIIRFIYPQTRRLNCEMVNHFTDGFVSKFFRYIYGDIYIIINGFKYFIKDKMFGFCKIPKMLNGCKGM